jgi:hypothetical protein
MTYEVIIEEFVLQVEVIHIEDTPPNPNTWSSDWDYYGSRELEFKVVAGNTYDDHGKRVDVPMAECLEAGYGYANEIERELWRQIDSQPRRSRWAA